jgi:DNA polymerase III beta subunit, central domain
MQTIRFSTEMLKAVAFLAGTKDHRAYLNGVLVEARKHETRLVASCGHKLGIVRMGIENAVDHDTSVIIPLSVLRQIKVRARPGLLAILAIDGDKHYLQIPEHGLQYEFIPVKDKYVDYARTVPGEFSGTAAQFDPQHLMDFSRCAAVLTGKPVVPRVTPNGDKAALVTINGYNDFVGVVMPYRFKATDKPADVNWFRKVRLSTPGQDHANSPPSARRGNRAALTATR